MRYSSIITASLFFLTGCSDTNQAGTPSSNTPEVQNQAQNQYQAFTPQEVEQAKKMTAEYFARFEEEKITTQAEMGKDILSNFRGYIKDIYTDAPGSFLEAHKSVIQHKPKPGQDENFLEINYNENKYSPWGSNGDKYWMYKGST